ncbi:50S ribosomal protein L3 [Candidatus Pacearchaeota archaeon]|nr:50S ribosomal protein L3P [uncultured archaeon]MBS3077484.1 50S ribosomal protein L3 [Candidatus Pacearchaeota archaeon]
MSTRSRPRAGSLQFWPRKRAAKVLPSANWRPIHSTNEGVLGFIAYKAGMASVMVKDLTDKSMTLNKQIVFPVTVLEVPSMKIYSVRFYKNGKVLTEIVVSNDKELKRKVKLGKTLGNLEKAPKDYDDIRVIAFSLPKQTNIKKTPDMIELAIQSENKLEFVKKLIGKELSLSDFSKSDLLDVRGLTIGKGTQGPIKRFGATLRFHKSEKGLRKIGSIGPWHPARVTYQVPMAGQMGYFSRVVYNLNLVNSGKISDKDINPSSGFPHYGKIKTSYVLLRGSVPGPAKRQILLTPSYRPTKMQAKKKYEFLEVLQ